MNRLEFACRHGVSIPVILIALLAASPRADAALPSNFAGAPENGLRAWFSTMGTMETSGSEVLAWHDVSGNGRDAIVDAGGSPPTLNRPGWSLRDMPHFGGPFQRLKLPDGTVPAGSGSYTVVALASTSYTPRAFLSAGTSQHANQGNLFFIGHDGAVLNGWVGNDLVSPTGLVANDVPYTFAFTYDAASVRGLNHFIRIFGNTVASRSATGRDTTSTGNYIGWIPDDDKYWVGDIAELLVYDRGLSTAELASLENWMGFRYHVGRSTSPTPLVGAGDTGSYLLGSSGMAINFESPTGTNANVTGVAAYSYPGGTVTAAGVTAPDGSMVVPNAFTPIIHWTATWTPAGGQDARSAVHSMTVSLDAPYLASLLDLNKAVILQRPAGSNTPWVPLNTTRIGTTLSTSGLQTLGDFAIGYHKQVPDDIAGSPQDGLRLWLRADHDAEEYAPGALNSLGDASAYNHRATAVNGALVGSGYVHDVLNGKPVLRFDGSAAYFDLPDDTLPSGAGPYEVFVVASGEVGSNRGFLGSGESDTNKSNSFRYDADGSVRNFWWGNDIKTSPGTVTSNTPYMMSFLYDGTSRSISFGGGDSTSGGSSGRATTARYNFLGWDGQPNEYWKGDIAEVIVYDRALAEPERERIGNYLGLKYGLGLSTTATPTFSSPNSGVRLLGSTGAAVFPVDLVGGSDGSLSAEVSTADPGGVPSGESALAPDGTTVQPSGYYPGRYWTLGVSGFSPTPIMTVSVDTTGITGIANLGKCVLMRRSGPGDSWHPLQTYRIGSTLHAGGLTTLGQFAVGALGPISNYDFPTDTTGWEFHNVAPFFAAPNGAYVSGSGALRLAATNNTGTFGWWESPVQHQPADARPAQGDQGDRFIPRTLLSADWILASNQSDPTRVPTIRLRSSASNSQQTDLMTIDSSGPAAFSPTTTPRTQRMYWYPAPGSRDFGLEFDMLNFDPADAADGSVDLQQVILSVVPGSSFPDAVLERTFTFADSVEGWNFNSLPGFFSAAEGSYDQAGGRLVMTYVPVTTGGFEFSWWGSPEGTSLVTPTAGRIYLVDFTVGSDQADASKVPGFRLRVNESRFQGSQQINVASTADGANSPIAGAPKTYTIVFPADLGVGGYLIFSMDSFMAAGDGDMDTAKLYLEDVRVRSVAAP